VVVENVRVRDLPEGAHPAKHAVRQLRRALLGTEAAQEGPRLVVALEGAPEHEEEDGIDECVQSDWGEG